MSSFKGLITKFINGLANELNSLGKMSDCSCKPCGNPKLDILLKRIDDTNNDTHIVIIKNRNNNISEFINNYRKDAEIYGKVFFETFAVFPDESKKRKFYDAFDEIHILRFDEFMLGLSGWLAALPLETVSFISKALHPLMGNACVMLAEEKGENTSSIDAWEGYAVMCCWLKECMDILENIPKFLGSRMPQKVYYKGRLKKTAICFLYFLSRIGCNVMIELFPGPGVDNFVSSIPKFMKVEVISE